MAQGPFEQVGGLEKVLEKPLEVVEAFHFSTFKHFQTLGLCFCCWS